MNKKLQAYVTLVDFLAEFMGENTEVVLHDMTDWHHSVIANRQHVQRVNTHLARRDQINPSYAELGNIPSLRNLCARGTREPIAVDLPEDANQAPRIDFVFTRIRLSIEKQ